MRWRRNERLEIFKKMRVPGNISCKIWSLIKDQNSMHLTETEKIMKEWQKYRTVNKQTNSKQSKQKNFLTR